MPKLDVIDATETCKCLFVCLLLRKDTPIAVGIL